MPGSSLVGVARLRLLALNRGVRPFGRLPKWAGWLGCARSVGVSFGTRFAPARPSFCVRACALLVRHCYTRRTRVLPRNTTFGLETPCPARHAHCFSPIRTRGGGFVTQSACPPCAGVRVNRLTFASVSPQAAACSSADTQPAVVWRWQAGCRFVWCSRRGCRDRRTGQ